MRNQRAIWKYPVIALGTLVTAVVLFGATPDSPTITTVAGDGTEDYSGDGGAATSAQLYLPLAVAIDGAGNLYIAEEGNNCIAKVNTSAIISIVAGNGTEGYSGDGGAATSA